MKNTVILFKHFLQHNSLPLIFVSMLLMLLYALPNKDFSGAAELSAAYLVPSFTAYYSIKSYKKAAVAGFSCLACSLIFHSFSGIYLSLLFSALFAFLSVKLLSGVKLWYGFALLFSVSAVLSVALGLSYEFLLTAVKAFAGFLSSRGALFGAINNLYELAVSPTLSQLVYHTSYSGATVDIGGIRSGIVDIFSGRGVSQLLTGKYFVNISLTAGVFFALYKKVKGSEKSALCFVCALAFVFGDVRLLCIYLVFYNPVMYFVYIINVFVSYLIPSLLDLRIGFKVSGSLLELIKYGNSWGYFICCAFVLAVLMYFASRLVFSRFDIDRGRYVTRGLKRLIISLGGADNLLRLDGNVLTVKNPNLIDILKIDCDIKQNSVSLFQEDAELLSDFFK